MRTIFHRPNKNTPVRILSWATLFLSIYVLVSLAPIFSRSEIIPVDDFSHFWASGKLWLQQKNPYDTASVLTLLEQAGAHSMDTEYAAITLNPPWALLLFAPFSIFTYGTARVMWLIATIAILLLSSQFLWMVFDGRKSYLWLAWSSTFIFAPTISVLSKGQITPWIIPALVAFLYYTEGKCNPWLVGFLLFMLVIKPQLSFLIFPAIAFWAIQKRQWMIGTTFLSFLLLSTLVLLIASPNVFKQYLATMQEYPTSQWATPTIGSYLRLFWLGVEKFWIQYIPAILSILWLIVYYIHNHHSWDWHRQLPLLMIITSICNPYGWTYDQVILLPMVLYAAHLLAPPFKLFSILLWLLFLVINGLDMLLHIRLDEFWFLWLAPVYAFWYLLANRWASSRSRVEQP
jgi:hypothetical protein